LSYSQQPSSRAGGPRKPQGGGHPNATKLVVAIIIAVLGITGFYFAFVFNHNTDTSNNTSNQTNGGVNLQNDVGQVQGTTFTSTELVPTTITSTTTSTTTSISVIIESTTTTTTQIVTAPPPAYYNISGVVTMGDGYTPRTIVFQCTGINAISDTIGKGNSYSATVPNSVYCTVSVDYTFGPSSGVSNCGNGNFDQTVGAGSSTVKMDWGC